MKKKMVILLLFISISIYAVDKPRIRTGIYLNGNFTVKEYSELYPSSFKDKIFFSFEEKFCSFFKFVHRFDLYYTNYNKYYEDLENLNSFKINNTLGLYFKINNHYINLSCKPMYYYLYGEKYLKLMNKIEYKLSLNNFTVKTYYSNLYCTKEDSLFYHNIHLAFYWHTPKYEFIKYKTSFTLYMQHYMENKKNNDISILKSAKFNFELVIDFNKIDMEELFDKNNENDDFFEGEN